MRNNRRALTALLTGCFLAAGGNALAVLEGSHHDLPTFTAAGTSSLCFYCHGLTDTSNASAMVTAAGSVGALCLGRCHQGNALITATETLKPDMNDYPNVTASDTAANVSPAADIQVVYWASGHGNNPALLLNPVTGARTAIEGTTFPYTSNAATAGSRMQCTSCHAVHDNANTPFIWQPLAGTGVNFCSTCHTERATNTLVRTVAPDGNHPVDFVVNAADAAGRAGASGATDGRLNRRISIDTAAPGRYFDVLSANGAALNAPGTHYTMGGKLGDFANWDSATTTQRMGCYTCHAVHTDKLTTGFDQNLVSQYYAATVGQNALCMGCHGGSTTFATNYTAYTDAGMDVGMTGFGHAVNQDSVNNGTALNYVTSVGGFRFTIADPSALNTGAGVSQLGPNGEVLCSSCHDVHGGEAGSKSIARGFGSPMCIGCHTGADLADVQDVSEAGTAGTTPGYQEGANVHHRTATKAFNANATGTNDGDTLVMGNPSWASDSTYGAVTGAWGRLSDGLQCHDCHVGNKTAHNW